jgi:hypothetical protein
MNRVEDIGVVGMQFNAASTSKDHTELPRTSVSVRCRPNAISTPMSGAKDDIASDYRSV